MKSKLDSSLKIDLKWSVVSIVLSANKIHALLVIESLEQNSYKFTVVDFLPAGVTNTISLDKKSIIKNPTDDGLVRIRLLKNLGKKTKEAIFEELDFFPDKSLSWKCTTKDLKEKLLSRIYRDKENPPKFVLSGDRRFFAPKGFNCITWIENLLKGIKIKLKLSISTKTTDKTIAIPEYRINDTKCGNKRMCTIL